MILGNIVLGGGDDRLTLNMGMGMSVGGTIDGGLGTDRLFLDGGMAGESQTFNNTVSGVELLVKDGAGKWVLGNNYSFGVGAGWWDLTELCSPPWTAGSTGYLGQQVEHDVSLMYISMPMASGVGLWTWMMERWSQHRTVAGTGPN